MLDEAFGDAQSSSILALKRHETGTKGPYILRKAFHERDSCTSNRRVKQAIVEKTCFCATKVSSARNRLLKLDQAMTFQSAHRLTGFGVWRNDANARVRTIDLFHKSAAGTQYQGKAEKRTGEPDELTLPSEFPALCPGLTKFNAALQLK